MKSNPNYNSLDDIPIYNWLKFSDTKDLKWLGNPSVKTLEKLNDEYLAVLVNSPDFIEAMKAQRDRLVLDVKANIEKDPISYIKHQASKLNEGKKSSNFDMWNLVAMVERKMGFSIDVHKIPTTQFFAYLNIK